jgi:large subunit ribosomal protein L9
MAIEVLLRRNIEGVGKVGEVVRVRNGYARNFLLPYQMAALVTPQALHNIEKDKAAEAIREADEAKQRAALSEKLAAIELKVEARAGEDGHLYGSVGARQVIDTLKRHGLRFEERQIRFETVRELGEYEVPIQLTREHSVKVKLWVVLDPEDAKAHAENAERRASEEAAMARYAAENAAPAAPAAGDTPAAEPAPGAKAEAAPAEGGKKGKKAKK